MGKPIRICLEVEGSLGVNINLGEVEALQGMSYQEIVDRVSLDNLIDMGFRGMAINKSLVRVITPEEYDIRYGDKDGK